MCEHLQKLDNELRDKTSKKHFVSRHGVITPAHGFIMIAF